MKYVSFRTPEGYESVGVLSDSIVIDIGVTVAGGHAGLSPIRQLIAKMARSEVKNYLAELAERTLRDSGAWTIVTPAQLAVVTFRYEGAGLGADATDALHGRLVEEMMADGFAIVTSTVLNGRPVLRLCTINPRTADADIEETIRRLTLIARRLSSAGAE